MKLKLDENLGTRGATVLGDDVQEDDAQDVEEELRSRT